MIVAILVFGTLLAFGLTWGFERFARRRGLLDVPNERSSHQVPTPRGGGIAVAVSVIALLPVLFLVGALPKEAMGHNLTVLKPGTDAVAFALKGVTAKATDYVAPEVADQVLAHTKVLGPGESETIEVELTAGTYPFVCTFPGHAAIMNGQLVVQ